MFSFKGDEDRCTRSHTHIKLLTCKLSGSPLPPATKVSTGLFFLLFLQRSTAIPQNLLPSSRAWSPDQHHAAMLANVSLHILGRTERRGLGFGQLVRTHTGKCLKCQPPSDGHSDHSFLCTGATQRSAGPAPVSKLSRGVSGIHCFLSFSLH